jgi:hypothetical protein
VPLLFRSIRRDSVIMRQARQYAWYAMGEVALIFVGITLALAFDDWSTERNLRRQELAAMQDISANLGANVDRISANIEGDSARLENCQKAISVVEERFPWRPEHGGFFEGCRYWTSPYFQAAAYESLKADGTDLVTNQALRADIVGLYEQTYAWQAGDIDREQWDFQAAVLLPVWNRYLRATREDSAEPSDYDALLDSGEFLNALYNRRDLLRRSLEAQNESLDATHRVIAAIQEELNRLSGVTE